MTYEKFLEHVEDAKKYDSMQEFLNNNKKNRDEINEVIYAVANSDFKTLAILSGNKNINEACEFFNIPQNTGYKWSNNIATPPQYIYSFIGYIIIENIIEKTGERVNKQTKRIASNMRTRGEKISKEISTLSNYINEKMNDLAKQLEKSTKPSE